jgi:hypothetical protein
VKKIRVGNIQQTSRETGRAPFKRSRRILDCLDSFDLSIPDASGNLTSPLLQNFLNGSICSLCFPNSHAVRQTSATSPQLAKVSTRKLTSRFTTSVPVAAAMASGPAVAFRYSSCNQKKWYQSEFVPKLQEAVCDKK